MTIVGLLALKMKALRSFDTFVTIYNSTRHNIPEDLNLEQHCSDGFRFCIHLVVLKDSIPSSQKRHPSFIKKATFLIFRKISLF